MLVLRRRPGEAILFDGGLRMTLSGLQEHRAWLAFSAPCLTEEVALTAFVTAPGTACIAVRGPRRVGEDGTVVSVETSPGATTVVLVNRQVGESIAFSGMSVSLQAVEADRAVLGLDLEVLPSPVGVSIFAVTGAEAKIGIEAPREVRVFREEVWRELEAANAEAGGGWSEADLASLSATRRRT